MKIKIKFLKCLHQLMERLGLPSKEEAKNMPTDNYNARQNEHKLK